MVQLGAAARTSLALTLVASGFACSRSAPSFTDDSTDDGGPPNFGPYDPNSGGEPPNTSTTSTSSTTTSSTTDAPWPDLPSDGECNLIDDPSCPPGDKCVPDFWNCCGVFECAPVSGDGQIGDACSNSGPGSNIDDCGADSYCLEGECRGFCDAFGECPGDGLCLIYGGGPVWVCIDQCDPLAQDCAPDEGCYYTDEFFGFECRPIGDEPGLGDPCDVACTAGTVCIPAAVYPGACAGDSCCTSWCDLDIGCINGPPGSTCTELGFPGHPQLGVCTGSGASVQPGDLQIVEINSDPPGLPIYEPPYEYVEIINLSAGPINLAPLEIDDFVGNSGTIGDRYQPSSGDGGCANISPYCLAPGRRALFVGNGYVGSTGDALVLSSDNLNVFGSLLQPFTRLDLTEPGNPEKISSYRLWDNPSGDPLPVDEQPMHRIDEQGDDVPDNWASGPGSPGL